MKTAVIFSGGGAKGSVQFGILKYLYEQGLRPDVVYGTSVGSLNACGYAFQGIEGLEKFWGSIKKFSHIFKLNWGFFLGLSSGLYNANPLKKLVEACTSVEPKIDAYSCKVNIETGEIKYVHCKEADYIISTIASCSIPALNNDIDGWVDGGVREQTPLKRAIIDGADKIIVILTNPLQKNPPPGKKGNWIKNLLRATDVLAHEIYLNDLQCCLFYNTKPHLGKKPIELVVYAPRELVIDSHDFKQEKIQPAIVYGYEQAKLGPISLDYIIEL